jgi:hypothetical protein
MSSAVVAQCHNCELRVRRPLPQVLSYPKHSALNARSFIKNNLSWTSSQQKHACRRRHVGIAMCHTSHGHDLSSKQQQVTVTPPLTHSLTTSRVGSSS